MSSQDTENTLPGHWIVKLRAYVNPDIQQKHISLVGRKTDDESTTFSCKVHNQFDFPEFKGYSAQFDDATKSEIVEMNEPVRLYRHCKRVSQENAPWGLERISAHGSAGSAPYTYNYEDIASGQGTIAYVLDTGINDKHVEFEGRASRGKKFVNTWIAERKKVTDEDVDGHGTHCAGTLASRAYGVAKKANVVGIKVFNDEKPPFGPSAADPDLIKAIEHVRTEVQRHGKKSVISLSLGGPASPDLDSAVAAAVRDGIIVCVAAGNEDAPATEGSPAREPLAITVGGTDIGEAVPDFANYGKMVDVLAPAVDILSCWIGSKTATERLDGTSQATPHVAGAACCLLSNPTLRDLQTSDIMSQILIQSDKNRIDVEAKKRQTINAVLQVNDLND